LYNDYIKQTLDNDERTIMNKKWCLLNASDCGPMGRGQSGKKKVYEIIVTDSTLRCEWGMAEKTKRQSSVQVYRTPQAALAAAYEKLYAKQDRGYQIAYAV
jgi:predicted DNA-binding WGR domain protein